MYFLGAQTSFRCVGGCDVLEERAYPFCGEGENIRKMDKDTGYDDVKAENSWVVWVPLDYVLLSPSFYWFSFSSILLFLSLFFLLFCSITSRHSRPSKLRSQWAVKDLAEPGN